MKRGFTLMELMIVTTIASISIAAVGAFYLEMRASAARAEAELSMTRQASLALEWIARDAAGADEVQSDERGATVVRGAERVRWEIREDGLFRVAGERARPLAVRAVRLEVEHAERGDRFRLTSERSILRGRRVTVIRSALIARRR